MSIKITSEALRKEDLAALAQLLTRGVQSGDFGLQTGTVEIARMVLELIEGRAYHSVLDGTPMRKLQPGLGTFLRNALGVLER